MHKKQHLNPTGGKAEKGSPNAETRAAVAETRASAVAETMAASGAETMAAAADTMVASGEADTANRPFSLPMRDPARYRRYREIARGGMGRIVSMFDEELGRVVAVKELLYRDELLERRFEREIEITARLQHPAIIAVHEAGRWPDGCAFYTMKQVEGGSFDTVISEKSHLSDRLGLLHNVVAVADALAYAHSERIIHRDLKPGNVLVGPFGETVVVDWGLAKRIGEEDASLGGRTNGPHGDLTVLGQAMGTPAYMPPEQARGESTDARADVYSLGAMLYHLLAGKAPYADAPRSRDILEPVLSGAPTRLAQLAPEAPVELLTIVDKAMARDPDARYVDAGELVDDLRRFETGQLVGAHHYTAWALLRRWLRKHRALVAVSAAALAVLGILGTLAVLGIRAERDEANEQRLAAEQERSIAEVRRAEVEDLLDFMLVDLRGRLVAIGKLELLGMVAEKAADYYATRPVDWAQADPARKRSVAYENVASVLAGRGDLVAAQVNQQASLDIALRLAREHPGAPQLLRRAGGAHMGLAGLLVDGGKLSEALAGYRLGADFLEQALALAPEDPDVRRDLAIVRSDIGQVLQSLGNLSEALSSYRVSLQLQEALRKGRPHEPVLVRDEGTTRARIARLLAAKGEAKAALAEALESQKLFEQLSTSEPESTSLLRDLSLSNDLIADLYLEQGDVEAALASFRAGMAAAQSLARLDPTNAEWQRDLIISHQQLSRALEDSERDDDAIAELRAAVAQGRTLSSAHPANASWNADLATSLRELGRMLGARGQHKESLVLLRESLALRQVLVAAEPLNTTRQKELSSSYQALSAELLAEGALAEAMEAASASQAIMARLVEQTPGNADWVRSLSISEEQLHDVLQAKHEPSKAAEHLRRALELAIQLRDSYPDNTQYAEDVTWLESLGH